MAKLSVLRPVARPVVICGPDPIRRIATAHLAELGYAAIAGDTYAELAAAVFESAAGTVEPAAIVWDLRACNGLAAASLQCHGLLAFAQSLLADTLHIPPTIALIGIEQGDPEWLARYPILERAIAATAAIGLRINPWDDGSWSPAIARALEMAIPAVSRATLASAG